MIFPPTAPHVTPVGPRNKKLFSCEHKLVDLSSIRRSIKNAICSFKERARATASQSHKGRNFSGGETFRSMSRDGGECACQKFEYYADRPRTTCTQTFLLRGVASIVLSYNGAVRFIKGKRTRFYCTKTIRVSGANYNFQNGLGLGPKTQIYWNLRPPIRTIFGSGFLPVLMRGY